MEFKKISITISFWLIFVVTMAQVSPAILEGKADSQECKDWVESRLEEMTLKEKIGQLFIHTVPLHDTEVNRKNIRNRKRRHNKR